MTPTKLTRRTFTGLAAAGLLGLRPLAVLAAGEGPDAKPIRILVWDERQPKQKLAYDNFLGNAIADHLKKLAGFEVKSVGLDDPEQGLTQANLDGADVLIWWGHIRNRDVLPNVGKAIVERIRAGKLSLITLHSAHWSIPFIQAMYARATDDAMKLLSDQERKAAKLTYVTPLPQTPPTKETPLTPSSQKKVDAATGAVELSIHLPICCFPTWREDGKPSHVTTLLPDHPIAKGIPAAWDIPHTEMYSEPFHVPKPDVTLFLEKWDAGEQFHSGMIWEIGKGKVFYFRPGHESFAVYKEELPLRVLENAARWLTAEQAKA